MYGTTLLLNSSFEPITSVSVQRALVLVLSGKAEIVEDDETIPLKSPSVSFPSPVVIKLIKYVKIPYANHIGVSRRAIIARDGYRCVYCNTTKGPLTIDHVIPRSKGGPWVWTNLVSSCVECNRIKGSKTLDELGWKLSTQPRAPQGSSWRILNYNRSPDPRWSAYLG